MATKEPDKSTTITRGHPGRPEIWTEELADKICGGLALGQSLKKVLEPDGMPDHSTIFNWLRTKEGFLERYQLAKEAGTEAMAEYLLDIADDGTNDYMEDEYMKGKTPGWQLNGENIQRSKLRVDARKWLMSKYKPKKYGDKIDMTTNGKDLPTPILANVTPLKSDNQDAV